MEMGALWIAQAAGPGNSWHGDPAMRCDHGIPPPWRVELADSTRGHQVTPLQAALLRRPWGCVSDVCPMCDNFDRNLNSGRLPKLMICSFPLLDWKCWFQIWNSIGSTWCKATRLGRVSAWHDQMCGSSSFQASHLGLSENMVSLNLNLLVILYNC